MKKLRHALLLVLVASAARAEDGVVKTETGEVQGRVVERNGKPVRVWKGIPYAAPPVGALRWKPPERAAAWSGVRECTKFGPACPQPALPLFETPEGQDESCLFLNVWAPAGAEKLPVMFWIHGGSYVVGSGAQTLYDGEHLARRGVVLVTINYRLGPFGFFCHRALSKESGKNASGDYGLLDQVAALEWVKRNIAAFGGDPGLVTVFGESAGAGSVGALLCSPLAKGLFHRAILESGTPFARPLHEDARGMEAAEKTGERIARALGCDEAKDPLAALRAKSAPELLAAASPSVNPIGEGNVFGPVIDGWVIPEDPVLVTVSGKLRDVPLLLGTTENEGSVFLLGSPAARSVEAYTKFARTLFGKESGPLLEHYAAATDDDVPAALEKLVTDVYFVAPTRTVARSRRESRTWLYHFTRVSETAKALKLGACHGLELRYVFGTLEGSGVRDVDHALSKAMGAAWVRFARTGDPNGGDLPAWPAFTREKDEHLEFGDTIRAGSGLHRESCDLIDSAWIRLSER